MDLIEYKNHESHTAVYREQITLLHEKISTYLVQLSVIDLVDTEGRVKELEKKFAREKELLESKLELHKRQSAVLHPSVVPSSLTSNKLIPNKNSSFSTTPYLQKITLIRLSRLTPITNKVHHFTTSTPDNVSPLKKLVNESSESRFKRPSLRSIFDDDDDVLDDDSLLYKKIKLPHKEFNSDDEEVSVKPIIRSNISPLKNGNVFNV